MDIAIQKQAYSLPSFVKERLEGKNILITGGTGGIGHALVDLAAKAGADVIFTYHNDKGEGARDLMAQYCNNLAGFPLTLEDPRGSAHVAEYLSNRQEACGKKVNYLILNAGTELSGDLIKHTPEKMRQIIDANLAGNLEIIREVIVNEHMYPECQIAIIGSIAADGNHDQLAYSAAKAGLRGAIESLVRYDNDVKKQGLGIKLIEPAFVRTPMTERILNLLERRVIKAKGGDALVEDFRKSGYVISAECAAQKILEMTVDSSVTGRRTIPEGASLHEIRARYF